MFSSDVELAKAQGILLEMLKEIHDICERHNITYWLEGGTLLGAIRHKGFIPWDDDVDIAMPVEDFARFCEIAPKELSEMNFLQTASSDPAYTLGIGKVRRNGTVFLEQGETGREAYHHGIFVDIIPCDFYCRLVFFSRVSLFLRELRGLRNKYRKNSIQRLMLGFLVNVLLFPLSRLIKFLHKRKRIFLRKEGSYLTHYPDFGILHPTKANDILPVVLQRAIFEGEDFYVPKNPQAYLRSYFDKGYMNLPHEGKRRPHHKFLKVN